VGLNPQVEDVLVRALSKNKTDRFPGVIDFAAALEEAVTGTVPLSPTTVALPAPSLRLSDSEAAVSAPAKSTTFTHTAGELEAHDGRNESPRRSKWV
jgi:hypothetical protein